jgi:hypothetical protein
LVVTPELTVINSFDTFVDYLVITDHMNYSFTPIELAEQMISNWNAFEKRYMIETYYQLQAVDC